MIYQFGHLLRKVTKINRVSSSNGSDNKLLLPFVGNKLRSEALGVGIDTNIDETMNLGQSNALNSSSVLEIELPQDGNPNIIWSVDTVSESICKLEGQTSVSNDDVGCMLP